MFFRKNELGNIFKIPVPVLWFVHFSCITLIGQNYGGECILCWVWWHWSLGVILWSHLMFWLMEEFVLFVPTWDCSCICQETGKTCWYGIKRPTLIRGYFWQLWNSTYLIKILEYPFLTYKSLKWCLCMSLKKT